MARPAAEATALRRGDSSSSSSDSDSEEHDDSEDDELDDDDDDDEDSSSCSARANDASMRVALDVSVASGWGKGEWAPILWARWCRWRKGPEGGTAGRLDGKAEEEGA